MAQTRPVGNIVRQVEIDLNEHINNVFKEGELRKEEVVRKFRIATQHSAIQGKTQEHDVMFYNLDVIISVGYRVKSQRGTQFRIWSNRVLKEYLVKGYAVNNRLAQEKYEELSQLVKILGRTVGTKPELTGGESQQLVSVVTDYSYALDTLDRYDYQKLSIDNTQLHFQREIQHVF